MRTRSVSAPSSRFAESVLISAFMGHGQSSYGRLLASMTVTGLAGCGNTRVPVTTRLDEGTNQQHAAAFLRIVATASNTKDYRMRHQECHTL